VRAFLVLARLRLLDVLRSKSSIGFSFLFPVLLVMVIGLVFLRGHPFEQRYVAVVASAGVVDAEIARSEEALAALPEVRLGVEASEAEALGKLRSRMASAVLVREVPDGPLSLWVGPRDGIFGRGLLATLPVRAELRELPVPRWGYVHYLFPGLVTFAVLIAGLYGLGYTMVLYRQNLFLKKLATTPLRRHSFMLAQIAARAVVVLVQVLLMAATARLCFDLHFSVLQVAYMTAIATLGLSAFMGLGFVLSCVVKNPDVMSDVINAVNLPLVFLSEIFFPLEALPRPLAVVGEILPSTEVVRLLRATLLYGVADPRPLLPGFALLAAWSIVTFAVGLWAFKWHE
jgi:ABC-2 type transport system permease protein